MSIQKEVGAFLTNLMDQELTHHLGRDKYERKEVNVGYHNGSYNRTFCIKGIGDVEVRIPRDRDGDFKTQVIPRGKQYEDRITEDLAAMYLMGISTRTLSLLSKRLIGRPISAEPKEAIEKWRTRDLSHEKIKYLIH